MSEVISDPSMMASDRVQRAGFTPDVEGLDGKHAPPPKKKHRCSELCSHAAPVQTHILSAALPADFGTVSLNESLLPAGTGAMLRDMFAAWCVPVPKDPNSKRKNRAMITRSAEPMYLYFACFSDI